MKKIRSTTRLLCPVCKSPRLTEVDLPDCLFWKSCCECGSWVFLGKEKAETYPENYYGGPAAKFSGWAQHLRTHFHRQRACLVQKAINRIDGKVYDVGCGDGLFLKEAYCLGLRIGGFEPQSTPRRQTEKRLGKELDEKVFASLKSEKASAITCWQVIEHMDDPPSFLQACRQRLADGGLLTISTVNLDSLQARCFGGKWLHLDPPRHLWIGNLPRVIQLVKDAGFSIEKVRYNSLEFGPVGWVDSLFNIVDTKRDRLLACLKQGCQEPRDWLVYILSIAFAPMALFLSLLEAGLQQPATFEIYARVKKDRFRRQGG